MSDNWIVLVPMDPRFVPDAGETRGRDWFSEIAPEADEIKIEVCMCSVSIAVEPQTCSVAYVSALRRLR